ncbi:MAG: CAP domain-containing protein [Angustibacter sp.]
MSWTDADTRLAPNTVYTFTVIEQDRLSGAVRWSDAVSITTPQALATSGTVTATPTESTLDLAWPAVAGASAYRVRRGDLVAAVTSAPRLLDVGLAPSTTYPYSIDALDTRTAPAQVLQTLTFAASTFRGPTPFMVSGLTAQTPTDTHVRLAWTPVSWVNTYDVLRDGVLIASVDVPAFDDTTAPATTYTYRVIAHLPDGVSLAASRPLRVLTPPVGTAPNITALTVTGSGVVGGALTAHITTSETPTKVTYQWFSDAGPLAFQSNATYPPSSEAFGHKVFVRVTATWRDGPPSTRQSAPVLVGAGTYVAARPKLTGTPRVGQIVRMQFPDEATGWAQRHYQWLRDGVAIPGAVTSSYRLSAADYRHLVVLRVTESVHGYLPVAVTSAAVKVGWGGTLRALSAAHIVGTVRAGRLVRAAVPSYSAAPTKYSYVWRLSGRTVSHSRTYRLPRSANGRSLRLYVRAYAPAHSRSSWSTTRCARVAHCRRYVPSTNPSDPAVAAAVIKWVNYYHRSVTQRPSLPADPYLMAVSQAHAVAMRAKGYIYHTVSPGGQNVGATFGSADETADQIARRMVVAWMNSAGHRAQIVRTNGVSWGAGVAHDADGAYFFALNVWTK